VIIFRLLPRLLVSGAADILELPRLDEVAAKKLYKEKPNEYVSLVVDCQKRLASAFYEYVTKDQTYHASNSIQEAGS
jgi:hypothetical protein